jgi:hypothetical protein
VLQVIAAVVGCWLLVAGEKRQQSRRRFCQQPATNDQQPN